MRNPKLAHTFLFNTRGISAIHLNLGNSERELNLGDSDRDLNLGNSERDLHLGNSERDLNLGDSECDSNHQPLGWDWEENIWPLDHGPHYTVIVQCMKTQITHF